MLKGNKELKELKELQKKYYGMVNEKKEDIAKLSNLIKDEQQEVNKIDKDIEELIKDITNIENVKMLKTLKSKKKDLTDLIEFQTIRLNQLRNESLLTKEEYDKEKKCIFNLTNNIKNEYAKELYSKTQDMLLITKEAKEYNILINEILETLQVNLYKNQDRTLDPNGERTRYTHEDLGVNLHDLIYWGERPSTYCKPYDDYKSKIDREEI